MKLVRFAETDGSPQIALLNGDDLHVITAQIGSLAAWLNTSVGRVDAAIDELVKLARSVPASHHIRQITHAPTPGRAHWLAPVDKQEVWAAGVTYERSRAARQEEAQDGGDVYARVYTAQRPELFFKSAGWRAIGHLDAIGVRADSAWNVPEPELALVFNPALEVVGMTIGNDVSSRDIEGANPLYLPQAKVYTRACALGPGISLTPLRDFIPMPITLTIERGGAVAFTGQTNTSQLRRSIAELAGYLGRAYAFPAGAVLLTGTGVVPGADFTLSAGDTVHITIGELGTLTNPVIEV